MKKLHLLFLWHMHQPYYKDDISGEYMMPWTFLHGIKDYYELPWLSSRAGIKATYNLVPSLIVQLEDYGRDLSSDRLLKLLLKKVTDLSSEEREVVATRCFESNVENMISPLPRYFELFQRKGSFFSRNELLDLEVLFLLSWCGNYLREENEVVRELIKKGRDYSEDEKLDLLETLRIFIFEILEKYRELEENGDITIFTTPFYHPITPILLDSNSVKEANIHTPVAEISADFTPHARLHTKNAIEKFEEVFGKKPVGFWPAEGAVSQETVNLFRENGISYLCSDEEILFKSRSVESKNELYKPYKLETPSGEVNFFFRDKALSDLIGFTYSNIPAKKAVEEFISKLRGIYESSENSTAVSIFLDGENAWEYYPDNAYEFFTTLYERIGKEEWIETNRLDETIDVEYGHLNKLRPGSWIGGCLDTWMGHREKNHAWELLSQTYVDFREFEEELEKDVKERIEKELFIAEGSDWFWWYGDDHYTHLAHEFDELFRNHLQNVYRLAEKEIPKELFEPIKTESGSEVLNERVPSSLISPNIDGKSSSFYEWLGAGKVSLSSGYSVMDSSGVYFLDMDYGIDKNSLYLRIDPQNSLEGKVVELHFVSDDSKVIVMDLGEKSSDQCGNFCYVYDDFLEISIDKEEYGIGPSVDIYFFIKIKEEVLQRAPLYKSVRLELQSGHDAIWYI